MTRVVLLALAALMLATAAQAEARARFDTQVFALIPRPGFPAMAYVHPNGRVYEGTYDNPSGDAYPSRVLEYDGDGTFLRSWTIAGQNLGSPHGVQVGTSDAEGNLILLDKSPARALVLDRRTGAQATYATFPEGSTPNYSAWGPDGSLYVTDYAKPVIWRIPPGGGAPQQWLTDPGLDGGMFGTTGIALRADQRTLVIGQQSAAGLGAGNPATGRLYTAVIGADGKPGPLTKLWESGPADGPDGFGIAKSGNIYVALLVSNQIAEVGPDGREITRFGSGSSPVPFDSPSSARFLGTSLMVANQSYFTGDPTHQAILDVEVGEPGLPELIPGAGSSPTTPAKKKCKKGFRLKKGKCKRKRRHRRRKHR